MASNKDSDHQKGYQGFASMDEDKQKEIASKGGKAAHEKGTAHELDSDDTREAGHKGSQSNSSHKNSGGTSDQHAKAGKQSHKNK